LKQFSEFIQDLTAARNEDSVQRILKRYFTDTYSVDSPDDALTLLAGHFPKAAISSRQLKSWLPDIFELPEWLLERSMEESGNIVTTVALLLKSEQTDQTDLSLSQFLEKLNKLYKENDGEIQKFISNDLAQYDQFTKILALKLLTGTVRSPVSPSQLILGLAMALKLPAEVVCLRLYTMNQQGQFDFQALKNSILGESELLPLYLPAVEIIGNTQDIESPWTEWSAYGIRSGINCQIVKHENTVHLWVEGPEIVSDLFPEICNSLHRYEGNLILTGQLVNRNRDLPISILQKYVGESSVGPQSAEAVFVVRDVYLNRLGQAEPDVPRFVSGRFDPYLTIEQRLHCTSWQELHILHSNCRAVGYDAFLLKRNTPDEKSYIWKAVSLQVKAVLMYVELDGSRYLKSITFGLHRGDEIVPVAKIQDDGKSIFSADILEFVKSNTLQRFGPVRTVTPSLVFELFFDGIDRSPRKKAGLTLIRPRIFRKVGDDPSLSDSIDALGV